MKIEKLNEVMVNNSNQILTYKGIIHQWLKESTNKEIELIYQRLEEGTNKEIELIYQLFEEGIIKEIELVVLKHHFIKDRIQELTELGYYIGKYSMPTGGIGTINKLKKETRIQIGATKGKYNYAYCVAIKKNN